MTQKDAPRGVFFTRQGRPMAAPALIRRFLRKVYSLVTTGMTMGLRLVFLKR